MPLQIIIIISFSLAGLFHYCTPQEILVPLKIRFSEYYDKDKPILKSQEVLCEFLEVFGFYFLILQRNLIEKCVDPFDILVNLIVIWTHLCSENLNSHLMYNIYEEQSLIFNYNLIDDSRYNLNEQFFQYSYPFPPNISTTLTERV